MHGEDLQGKYDPGGSNNTQVKMDRIPTSGNGNKRPRDIEPETKSASKRPRLGTRLGLKPTVSWGPVPGLSRDVMGQVSNFLTLQDQARLASIGRNIGYTGNPMDLLELKLAIDRPGESITSQNLTHLLDLATRPGFETWALQFVKALIDQGSLEFLSQAIDRPAIRDVISQSDTATKTALVKWFLKWSYRDPIFDATMRQVMQFVTSLWGVDIDVDELRKVPWNRAAASTILRNLGASQLNSGHVVRFLWDESMCRHPNQNQANKSRNISAFLSMVPRDVLAPIVADSLADGCLLGEFFAGDEYFNATANLVSRLDLASDPRFVNHLVRASLRRRAFAEEDHPGSQDRTDRFLWNLARQALLNRRNAKQLLSDHVQEDVLSGGIV